jgi:hypothetical protein
MKTSNSAPRHVRCPFCSAASGQPCRDREGQVLPGLHFQRVRLGRNAIAAALELYAPLGFVRRVRR